MRLPSPGTYWGALDGGPACGSMLFNRSPRADLSHGSWAVATLLLKSEHASNAERINSSLVMIHQLSCLKPKAPNARAKASFALRAGGARARLPACGQAVDTSGAYPRHPQSPFMRVLRPSRPSLRLRAMPKGSDGLSSSDGRLFEQPPVCTFCQISNTLAACRT